MLQFNLDLISLEKLAVKLSLWSACGTGKMGLLRTADDSSRSNLERETTIRECACIQSPGPGELGHCEVPDLSDR